MLHTTALEYLCNLPPLGDAERIECKLANITLTNEVITYEVMTSLQTIEKNIDTRTLTAWSAFNIAFIQDTGLPRRAKYLVYLRGRFYEMMHGAFSYPSERPYSGDMEYLTLTFRVLDHFLYCSYKCIPFPHEHISTID